MAADARLDPIASPSLGTLGWYAEVTPNVAPASPVVTHFRRTGGGFELRWERHTEFSTYTLVRKGETQTPFSSSVLSDGVNYAYGKGKLLMAAAGTSFSWTSWWGVIYPAAYSNCVAVTGVKENGSKCASCHDGSQVDLTICMERTSNSSRNSLSLSPSGATPSYIGGSSSATATAAGIAAFLDDLFDRFGGSLRYVGAGAACRDLRRAPHSDPPAARGSSRAREPMPSDDLAKVTVGLSRVAALFDHAQKTRGAQPRIALQRVLDERDKGVGQRGTRRDRLVHSALAQRIFDRGVMQMQLGAEAVHVPLLLPIQAYDLRAELGTNHGGLLGGGCAGRWRAAVASRRRRWQTESRRRYRLPVH